MYSVLARVVFWLYFICDSCLWYAECAPAVEHAWLLQRPSLDRKCVCAHGFGFRVLTGLTHIFGLGQKNRQEGDLSYLLEAPKSCLPGEQLVMRRGLTINSCMQSDLQILHGRFNSQLLSFLCSVSDCVCCFWLCVLFLIVCAVSDCVSVWVCVCGLVCGFVHVCLWMSWPPGCTVTLLDPRQSDYFQCVIEEKVEKKPEKVYYNSMILRIQTFLY